VARESRAVQNPTVLMVDHAIERDLCVTRKKYLLAKVLAQIYSHQIMTKCIYRIKKLSSSVCDLWKRWTCI